jgi:uncharacterized lipoprotein
MKNRIYWLLTLVLLVSMALAACSSDKELETAAEGAAQEQAIDTIEENFAEDLAEESANVPAEEPANDPVEEPAETEPAFSEAELDTAYRDFLG